MMIHPELELPNVLPDYEEPTRQFDTWEIEVHASDRPMDLIALMIQLSEEVGSAFGPSREFMGVGFSEEVWYKDIPAGLGAAKADALANSLMERFQRSMGRATAVVSRRAQRLAELTRSYVADSLGSEPTTPASLSASQLVTSFSNYLYKARERAIPKMRSIIEEWISANLAPARLQAMLSPISKYMRQQSQMIIRSEMQRSYVGMVQEVGPSLDTQIERVVMPTACERCKALAGPHDPSRPGLFWTHPNCSCTWRKAGLVETFSIREDGGSYSVVSSSGEPVGSYSNLRAAEDHREVIMAQWTAKTRDNLKESDFGDPEGRKFPIKDQSDLDDAARLIGHASDPDKVKARLIKIAKRKGLTLPASWQEDNDEDEEDLREFATTNGLRMSFNEINSAVQAAVNKKYPAKSGSYMGPSERYIMDMFGDGTVVVRDGSSGKSYKLVWVIDPESRQATISDETEVVPRVDYEEVRMSDDSFSLVQFSSEDGWVTRRGKIFEAGDFPDKDFVLSPEELASAARDFQGADLDVEHMPTIFSGKLGKLDRVWVGEDGHTLHGEAKLPAWVHKVIGEDPVRVSTTWTRGSKRIKGLALVLNPRISDAQLTAAFNEAEANQGREAEPVVHIGSNETRRSKIMSGINQSGLAQFFAGLGALMGLPASEQQEAVAAATRNAPSGASATGAEGQQGGSVVEGATLEAASGFSSPLVIVNNGQPATSDRAPQVGVVPSASFSAQTPPPATSEVVEETPREKQLREQLEEVQKQMAALAEERLDSRAAQFAEDLIRDSRALPAERETLVAAFKRASLDDAASPAEVTFSRDGSEVKGSRVDSLEALFKARPRHTLAQEEVGTGDVAPLANKMETMAPSTDDDGEPVMDEARKKKLMSMTPLGRSASKKGKKGDGDGDEDDKLPAFLKK